MIDDIPDLDHSTIGKVAEKGALRPHLKKCWTIPPKANGEFVARMEDVLDVYARRHDPSAPVVCMDEKPYQLLGPRPRPHPRRARPGPQRGLRVHPLRDLLDLRLVRAPGRPPVRWWGDGATDTEGLRRVVARRMADEMYPQADKVVLVMDNLNTHHLGALYEAFTPAEARGGCGSGSRCTTPPSTAVG